MRRFDEDWLDFTRIPPPALSSVPIFFLVDSPWMAKVVVEDFVGKGSIRKVLSLFSVVMRARVPLFAEFLGSISLRTTFRLRRSMLLCTITGSVVGRKAACGFVAYNILDRFNEFCAEIESSAEEAAVAESIA